MASSSESPFTPAFDAVVDTKLQVEHVPGMAIAVIQDDKIHANVRLWNWFFSFGESIARNALLHRQHHKAVLGAHWAQFIESDDNSKEFGSKVLILPRRKWGIVLLGNTLMSSQKVEEPITFHPVDILLGVPTKDRSEHAAKQVLPRAGSDTLAEANGSTIDKGANGENHLQNSSSKPGMPPALPLNAYAGTYHHPGYRSFTFKLQDSTDQDTKNSKVLFTNAADRTSPFTITMSHVTGEYWSATFRSQLQPHVQKAEFRIGESDEVNELAIAIDQATPEVKYWFKRIDE
ncbi:hypothetical protein MMC13_005855 [Lambiella insularis]|nr:hypothetical protein [Lambiella insularis]